MSWLLALQLAVQLVQAIAPIMGELGRSGHEEVDLSLLSREHAAALAAMRVAFATLPPDGT